MRRNKAFAAAGLLTLALGIGATTAVFSVVYGVLLRPLPYPAVSFAAAPATLVLVAIAACLVPAVRAASIDPAETLRSE